MRRSSPPRLWETRSGCSVATALVNEVLNGIRAGRAARDRRRRRLERPGTGARRPASGGSPSAASTAGGSRSPPASASTRTSCARWRRSSAHSKARRSSDLAYGRDVAGRLLGGYEARLEVVGLGRAASVFVANDAVFTYAGPLPMRVLPVRPVRARARRRRARSRDAALARPALFRALLLGPRDGRCVRRARRARPRPHRGRLRRPAPAPGRRRGSRRRDATAVFEAERDAVTVLV